MKHWLSLVMLLFGCASLERDEQGYAWELRGYPVEPIRIHRNVDVYLNCAFEEEAESCAIRREDGCDIYLPPNPAAWMEDHERRHCAGWSHPNYLNF